MLDLYLFLGPQPEAVVQQYQEVIGRPHLPSYWSLGFHLSQYGFPNIETLEQVVANFSANKVRTCMWVIIMPTACNMILYSNCIILGKPFKATYVVLN